MAKDREIEESPNDSEHKAFTRKSSNSSNSSSESEINHSIPIPVRIVKPELSTSSYTPPGNKKRVELSDFIEAKVRQMMDKEGVILDFSDAKLRGKIVTTTKIIKEITAHDGTRKIVEDEEIDEEGDGKWNISVHLQGKDDIHTSKKGCQKT